MLFKLVYSTLPGVEIYNDIYNHYSVSKHESF